MTEQRIFIKKLQNKYPYAYSLVPDFMWNWIYDNLIKKTIMKQFFKEAWPLLLLVFVLLACIAAVFISIRQDYIKGEVTKNYCGKVIDRGYDPPSSGYKSHTDPTYWLIFKDRDISRNIRVNVTPDCYYRDSIGQNVCFELSAVEMYHYGNVNEAGHLK